MEKKENIKRKLHEAEKVVTEILTEFPVSRDDDRILVWLYWRKQFPRMDDRTISVFRIAFLGGRLTSPDTITRARRKVQSKRADLSGISQGSRKDLAEIYRHYYGEVSSVSQGTLFPGAFNDTVIANQIYENIKKEEL